MRILHLSDVSLPDWRVEKSAISALKFGREVIFAGGNSKNYQTKTFTKLYEITWTERARRGIPFYWHSVKKQVERVIREVRPDIVHAHDVFISFPRCPKIKDLSSTEPNTCIFLYLLDFGTFIVLFDITHIYKKIPTNSKAYLIW